MRTNRNLFYGDLALSARLSRHFQRLRSRLSPGHERSVGQGLVEFALILPVLLLLILGIIEFSYVFTAYTSLFNAAREGARYGVVQPKDQAGIVNKAREKIFLVNPGAATIYVGYDNGPDDTAVFTDTEQIEVGHSRVMLYVTYNLPTITPLIHAVWPEFHIETQAARTIASTGEIASIAPGPGSPFPPGPLPTGGGTASISLSVTANPQMVHSDGDDVSFAYTVENTGDVDLTNVTITYSDGSTIAGTANIGDLAAGATASGSIGPITINATTTINFTVEGYDSGNDDWVSYSVDVTVTVIHPALELIVEANPRSVLEGGSVAFTYLVRNTGDVGLTNVYVVDSWPGSSPTSPLALGVGESKYWTPPRTYGPFNETTVINATATGTDPLGGTVSAGGSAQVTVVDFIPIVIQEPLMEGDTVVVGTAQTGETVFIYDPQDKNVTGAYNVTGGTFSFNVPPLVAGHTIIVSGYGQWDSAVVEGELDDILISQLCHGEAVVAGTAEPGETVNLLITDASYQDSTTVGGGGNFAFTLFGGMTLQYGQIVEVRGYGMSGQATVGWCGQTNASLVIVPPCGPAGATFINVKGYNWSFQNKNDDVIIRWDGIYTDTYDTPNQPPVPWSKDITVYVTEGTHTLNATNEALPISASATFISPCPSPNLVITKLELVTSTGVISTYQPLNFRATVRNVGQMPVNRMFWVDIYGALPSAPSEGLAWGAASSLGVGEETVVTVTLESGFSATGAHPIWALVDSQDKVDEANENDNAAGPVSVVVGLEGEEPSGPGTGTGEIVGVTQIVLTTGPVDYGRAKVWCRNTDTGEEFTTYSQANAWYELSYLPVGSYIVMGETYMDGVRYFGIVPSPIDLGGGEIEVAIVIMR